MKRIESALTSYNTVNSVTSLFQQLQLEFLKERRKIQHGVPPPSIRYVLYWCIWVPPKIH